MKKTLAILLSGNGSNFEAIAKACQSHQISANVALVISNQPNAFGIERARKLGIEVQVISHQGLSRKAFEEKLIQALTPVQPDYIVLAGFMRILSLYFLKHFPDKVVNIHPSLLPKYPGLDAIKRSLEAKETEIGVTVHFVSCEVDAGQIILQEKIAIDPQSSLTVIEEKIHQLEHRTYVKALQKLLQENENI